MVEYVRLKYPGAYRFLFAIPNGAYKSVAARMKFKREGLSPGFPDLGLLVRTNDFAGLFIEMKRVKNSVTSDEQQAWIIRLNCAGYCARICKGASEAMTVIDRYLAGKVMP